MTFGDTLRALAAKEASAAHGDADRLGDMIEALARCLGFTIAMASRGDPETIDRMMIGAEDYAHSEAVEKAKIAVFMSGIKR